MRSPHTDERLVEGPAPARMAAVTPRRPEPGVDAHPSADLLATTLAGAVSVPEQQRRQIAKDLAASTRASATPADAVAESVRFHEALVRAYDRLRQLVLPAELLSAAVEEAALVSGLGHVDLLVPESDGWNAVRRYGGDAAAGPRNTDVAPGEVREDSAEAAAVRRSEPILVMGLQPARGGDTDTSVGAGPYVVVPMLDSGRVIALFRGRHTTGEPVRRREISALSAFAAAMSGMWSCAVLVAGWSERIVRVQERTTSALQRALTDLTWGIGLQPAEESPERSPGRRPWGAAEIRRLSPRGRVVLRHLLAGSSNRQIATDLDLKVETVRKYTRTILREFGVENRAQLHRDDPGGTELRALLDPGDEEG